jgi:hypothetical protein
MKNVKITHQKHSKSYKNDCITHKKIKNKNHPRKLSHFKLVYWNGVEERIKWKKMVHFDDRFHTHLMIIILESLVSLSYTLLSTLYLSFFFFLVSPPLLFWPVVMYYSICIYLELKLKLKCVFVLFLLG